ncbi:MAG: alpha/beta fold hydrolase [Hyphomicrobium sp.]
MPWVKAKDGTQLYTLDWGSGPPIVFIHGWPLSSSMWEYQMVPLAEAGFRCVAYDRRGFGQSNKPYTGYDYQTLATDLAAVLEQLDLNDVTLVGFSMGGGEVAEYLARHNGAGRVTRAALVSSITPFLLQTADNPDGVAASVFEGMKAGLRKDRAAFLTDFTETFFGVGVLSSPVSMPMLASICEVAMVASPRATLDCVDAFSSTDLRAACRAISVPTLVIHGDADKTTPIKPTGHAAAELIPHAELEIYEGAPHGLFYTHRERLNRDLAAFASEGAVVLPEAA